MRVRNTRGRTWGQWSLIEASWWACDLCNPMSLRGFVAAAVTAAADRLGRQWAWMDEHPDDPAYAEWEEGWLALNAKYEAAWRLLEEATARVKEAG